MSVADINALERKYWELKSISRSGRLDLESFKAHVVPTLPEQFCKSKYFPGNKNTATYSESSQTSKGELFGKIVPSWMFDRVLTYAFEICST